MFEKRRTYADETEGMSGRVLMLFHFSRVVTDVETKMERHSTALLSTLLLLLLLLLPPLLCRGERETTTTGRGDLSFPL